MFKSPFARIFAALTAGAVLGIAFGSFKFGETPLQNIVAPFGALFIRLLRMCAVPTIFFSLIVAAASTPPSSLGRIGLKTVALYALTALIAGAVSLILGNNIDFSAPLPKTDIGTSDVPQLVSVSLQDTLLNIVPLNPFAALNGENILQAIFIAVVSGIALSFLRESSDPAKKEKAENLFKVCSGLSEIMFILIRWIMFYAPVGVFSLAFDTFAKNGLDILAPLSKFALTAYGAFLFQMFAVYAVMLKFAGWNPLFFFKNIRDVMLTAFVTRSSGAALPLSIETAEEKLNIPENIASFSLPLGATVNMNGVTIQQCLSVFFIASVCGVTLDFSQQITVLSVILLASVGTAGIPSGAVIMLLTVLQSIGLSPEQGSNAAAAYTLLLGIDALLDMGQTCLNVTGDLVCAAVVAKTETKKDLYHD